MRTQIIHLDRYDNFNSTRNKLMGMKVPRVILEFSTGNSPSYRKLDLVSLKRYANKSGSQLAIVTKNRVLISHCEESHIPHFSTIQESFHEEWMPIDRFRKRTSTKSRVSYIKLRDLEKKSKIKNNVSPISGIIILSIAVILFLVPVIIIFFPSAIIRIQQQRITQYHLITFYSSDRPTNIDKDAFIYSFSISKILCTSLVQPTSGEVMMPDEYAMGIVRFVNLTDKAIEIPAGTVVFSPDNPPIRFRTLDDIVLPGNVGEDVEANVQAVEAGVRGNIPQDEIEAIDGILGSMVSVGNPLPFAGGTEKKVVTASIDDKESTEKLLMNTLQAKCTTELTNNVPFESELITVSVSNKVISKEFFPEDTKPSDFISLTMKVDCKGRYITLDDMRSKATKILDDERPLGYKAIEDISLKKTSDFTFTKGEFSWNVGAERYLITAIEPEEIILQVLGKGRDEALSIIEDSLSLVDTPEIKISPSWWHKLPFSAWRIQIEIIE